jgi:hypothetical protein
MVRRLLASAMLYLVLSASATWGAEGSIQGWGQARFGMTLEEFRSAYPCQVLPNAAGDATAFVCLGSSNTMIGKGPGAMPTTVGGSFLEGRLAQIMLYSHYEKGALCASPYAAVMSGLIIRYGPPTFVFMSTPTSETALWRFEDLSSIAVAHDPSKACDLQVYYSRASDKPGPFAAVTR